MRAIAVRTAPTQTRATGPGTLVRAAQSPVQGGQGGMESLLLSLQRTHGNHYVSRLIASANEATRGAGQGRAAAPRAALAPDRSPAEMTESRERSECGCAGCARDKEREHGEYGDDPQEQTTHSGSASGNSFSSTFDPTTSTPVPNCDRLVITQSIRMFADGTAMMPGTYYSAWKCRDPTALSDGTYLDHGSCAYKTPYPVDRGIGTAGKSNATGSANATYGDAPTTGGGDKGFYSAANPGGWKTVTYKFENYALCAQGTDCVAASPGGPTWYDGVAWEYTKTAADHAAGKNGTATVIASLPPPKSGSTILQAFDQYNSAKGFVPC